MRKTLDAILLDSLKNKHVTAYVKGFGDGKPAFSGIVVDIQIVDTEDPHLEFRVETGVEYPISQEVWLDTDISFEVC